MANKLQVKNEKEYPAFIEEAFENMDASILADDIYRHSVPISKYLAKRKDKLLQQRLSLALCRYHTFLVQYNEVQNILAAFQESKFFGTETELRGQYHVNSAKYYYRQHDGKTALEHAEKAVEIFQQTGNKKWLGHALLQVYNVINSFTLTHKHDAFEILWQIALLCDETGLYDETMIIIYNVACTNIAHAYFTEEKYSEAELFLQGAFEKLTAVKSPQALNIQSFIGSALAYQEKHKEALEIFEAVYKQDHRKTNTSFNLHLMNMLLSCAFELKMVKPYLSIYQEYVAGVEKMNLPYELLKALCLKAQKYSLENNYKKAKSALAEAFSALQEYKMADVFYRLYYHVLWKTEKQFANHEAGWEAYKMCEHYRHRSIESLTDKKIEVLKNRIDMEKKLKENDRLKMELELNERELEMTATFLKKKNAMIDEIITFTNALSKKHKHQNALFEVKKKLISIKAEDTEKDKVKVLLDKNNQDYIKKITGKYPSITNTEAKLCALIKVGLGNKEIASLLVTSPRTVDTHRSNIRRKMGLKVTDNLERMLREI